MDEKTPLETEQEKTSPISEALPSERVREGWDALPGDSEAEVDYKREATVEVGGVSYLPQIGRLEQGDLGFLKPELCVELTVCTPDGRRIQFIEAVEYESDQLASDLEVTKMLDAVYGVALTRFDARSE